MKNGSYLKWVAAINTFDMKIKIKGNEYEIRYTLRALFIFEQIKGEKFEIKTVTDEFLFLYCLIMAGNKDVDLSFDDLTDELDRNPDLIVKYNGFMMQEMRKRNVFHSEDSDDKKKV